MSAIIFDMNIASQSSMEIAKPIITNSLVMELPPLSAACEPAVTSCDWYQSVAEFNKAISADKAEFDHQQQLQQQPTITIRSTVSHGLLGDFLQQQQQQQQQKTDSAEDSADAAEAETDADTDPDAELLKPNLDRLRSSMHSLRLGQDASGIAGRCPHRQPMSRGGRPAGVCSRRRSSAISAKSKAQYLTQYKYNKLGYFKAVVNGQAPVKDRKSSAAGPEFDHRQ